MRVLKTSYLFHVPACERLVVREDDGVVLGVGLVRPRGHPRIVPRHIRAEPKVQIVELEFLILARNQH